jgi:hypothetical protein
MCKTIMKRKLVVRPIIVFSLWTLSAACSDDTQSVNAGSGADVGNGGTGASGTGYGGGGDDGQPFHGEPSRATELFVNGYVQDQYGRIYNVYAQDESFPDPARPVHFGALTILERSETDQSWFCGTRKADGQLECWTQVGAQWPELLGLAPEGRADVLGVFI